MRDEAQDLDCVLVRAATIGGWYTLERRDHTNERVTVRTEYGSALTYSGRIVPDLMSCVEGTANEWLAIADAIERGASESFRSCEAIRTDDGYAFCSPRNSNGNAAHLTLDAARRVAANIRETIDLTTTDQATP